MNLPDPGNRKLFVLLCATCVLATLVYGIVAARRTRTSPSIAISEPPKAIDTQPTPGTPSNPSALAKLEIAPKSGPKNLEESDKTPSPISKPANSMLYFRTNALGNNYGKLTVVPLNALDQTRYSDALSCDRVHFAGGRGVCLGSDRGVFTSYFAVMFDDRMQPGRTIPLNGIPSRVRVSPGGRLAAITVFLAGQSYVSLNFSTRTTIVDTVRGEILIPDIETLLVSRNGEAFQSPDFNFWGVTFARDENRFYATLWSKGKTYLIEGDLTKRTARVIYENVECPSLSPDNTRIVFKKRVGTSGITWRMHILDLKTMREIALSEMRSVDDQMEWLDNDRVLYALSESERGSSASTDIWVVSVNDVNAPPHLLLKGGFSPAVVPAKM
jgi:hypothetical protein